MPMPTQPFCSNTNPLYVVCLEWIPKCAIGLRHMKYRQLAPHVVHRLTAGVDALIPKIYALVLSFDLRVCSVFRPKAISLFISLSIINVSLSTWELAARHGTLDLLQSWIMGEQIVLGAANYSNKVSNYYHSYTMFGLIGGHIDMLGPHWAYVGTMLYHIGNLVGCVFFFVS